MHMTVHQNVTEHSTIDNRVPDSTRKYTHTRNPSLVPRPERPGNEANTTQEL